MSDNGEYLNRLVDREALTRYLTAELGPASTFEIDRHRQGHSNETLFVTWGQRELVLRRPPPGETADTAHDILREHHVMDALEDTDVRVPRTILACEDHSVIGCDFYLMERERGDVIRDAEPPRYATAERRQRIGEELIDRLVEIHEVDPERVGLENFGRPDGYIERQVERWDKQFDWAFEVTEHEREIPAIDDIGSWLNDNVPESHPHTLVHGDYKPDNVMFGLSAQPEIVGVFDWELSTLGDPRFDLGWLLTYWRDPGDPDPAIPELIPTFMEAEEYPTRAELVERYESSSGISFAQNRFYRALAVYKLGALCEMFFRRYLEGNSDNPMYPKMRDRVPALADWAVGIINGGDRL